MKETETEHQRMKVLSTANRIGVIGSGQKETVSINKHTGHVVGSAFVMCRCTVNENPLFNVSIAAMTRAPGDEEKEAASI